MAKIKRRKAVNVRHRHIIFPLIGNLITSVITLALLIVAATLFIGYVCYLRTESAVNEFAHTVDLYREYGPAELERNGITMFVTDEDGNKILENGKDTSIQDIGTDLVLFKTRDLELNDTGVYACADEDDRFLVFDSNGMLTLRFFRFYGHRELDRLTDDNGVFNMPFWLSTELDDGSTICIKTNLDITLTDVVACVAVLLFNLIVFVIIVVNLHTRFVSSAIRENRLAKMLFEDPISYNHNWLWFLVRGRKILSLRRAREYRYAVVSLMFVKYRNFVMCHSLQEGDEMLRRVYDTISSTLTKDEIAAHSTAANFPMLIRYENREQLKDRLNAMIGRLENIDTNHKFAFQAGVCLIGDAGDMSPKTIRNKDADLDEEYNLASAARMTLESNGDESGIALFDEELVEKQKWIDRVQELQNKAVENEEFKVYYQPKYDPRTDGLKGAEALIRWDSPELGFVGPGKFIDIFENNGFIKKIDDYMLAHVARDQKRWLDMGLPCVPVSVNISRAHFVDSDLADRLYAIVKAAECPCKYIEIELTESAFFDDKKAMIMTIKKLQDYGFEVSMDDFGSGYSSLNSLKDLPLNVLKLDAGFFNAVNEDGTDRGQIVVSEAIRLAKNLNMRTVAEGIEQKEQVDFLAEEGCDMIQGYYYAKPMPGDEYEARMKGAE